jgi:hypothetical protein
MSHLESSNGSRIARRSLALLLGLSLAVLAGEAGAGSPFIYGAEPVHPACIHALAMHQGDVIPVTTAVSLAGCARSVRSESRTRYDGEILLFEDDELLGGGSFGYREITQLDNGIYGLAIRRVHPDGTERVSLAAVNIVTRAMIMHSEIVNVQIPGMDVLSFRSMGNSVHWVAGVGPDKVERNVDFTKLGRLRR